VTGASLVMPHCESDITAVEPIMVRQCWWWRLFEASL